MRMHSDAGTHATYLTCIKLTDLPQKAMRVPQSASEKTQTCTLRQAQHSVHTHTCPPQSCFTSASPERPPTRGPCPIFSKPSTSAGPHPSLQEETAPPRGRSFPPAPSPDGEPGAEPGPASLPIQQVLQVLRAVLLGAGAEPGCPGCRQEVLWRNGRPLHPKQERRVRSWGGHSPASSQLHSVPGLRVTLGSHCPKLPASPFIPSCPSQLTFPILPSPCHLRAWHRVHGEEQSSRSLFFPCLLPFPLPETRFPLSEA